MRVDHPPIIPILRFFGVLPLEKLFKQPCSNIEGWKLSFCFTAVKRLLSLTHMKQNTESWACYWQTLQGFRLVSTKAEFRCQVLFISISSTVETVTGDKMFHLPIPMTDDLNDLKITCYTVISCILSLFVYITILSWRSIWQFSYKKTCDTVKFLKKSLNNVGHDAFPFIRNFKNSTFHRHWAKYLCYSRCFLSRSIASRGFCKANKHFSSSFPYATPKLPYLLNFDIRDSYKCLLCLDLDSTVLITKQAVVIRCWRYVKLLDKSAGRTISYWLLSRTVLLRDDTLRVN